VTTVERHRLETALAVSVMVHVMAALWLGTHHMAPLPGVRPAARVIPVSLLGRPGGGGGARGPAPASPPAVAAPAPTPPAVVPERRPAPSRPAHPAVASHPPAHEAPATGIPVPAIGTDGGGATVGGAGQGTAGGGGEGGGDGTGGDGTGGARIAYGSNPKPPYPITALRMHVEGTVLLEVSVAPDGHASAVRLQHSSGHAALDDSALTTVRDRWRFVPARVGGVAVEGTVQVPIRFRLVDDE